MAMSENVRTPALCPLRLRSKQFVYAAHRGHLYAVDGLIYVLPEVQFCYLVFNILFEIYRSLAHTVAVGKHFYGICAAAECIVGTVVIYGHRHIVAAIFDGALGRVRH